MAQGKAFDKEKILEGLRPFFELGYSRYKTCKLTGFDEGLLSKWEKKIPELSVKIDGWINSISVQARKNWMDKVKEGKYQPSKDWLERIEKDDFSTQSINKVTVTNLDGVLDSLDYDADIPEEYRKIKE